MRDPPFQSKGCIQRDVEQYWVHLQGVAFVKFGVVLCSRDWDCSTQEFGEGGAFGGNEKSF
jgi:hypothetical protein